MTNKGLPHARGGVSEDGDGGWRRLSSSPRTWGCFRGIVPCRISLWVFPTHVGVFLASKYAIVFDRGLPHARGGVSSSVLSALSFSTSSPRTWGCFSAVQARRQAQEVFPTHVGVFPAMGGTPQLQLCLPHARGGVSHTADTVGFRPLSSLRTWGISKKLLIAVY